MLAFPRPLVTLLLASFAGITPAATPVTRIADSRLEDAALAVTDAGRPVIYYNPLRLAELGPALSSFVLAHEEAHIRLGHARSAATADADVRAWELDADCAAARALATSEPGSVRAALALFAGQGEQRADGQHPTGRERAQRIASCAS